VLHVTAALRRRDRVDERHLKRDQFII
jgi:hypothetical protein